MIYKRSQGWGVISTPHHSSPLLLGKAFMKVRCGEECSKHLTAISICILMYYIQKVRCEVFLRKFIRGFSWREFKNRLHASCCSRKCKLFILFLCRIWSGDFTQLLWFGQVLTICFFPNICIKMKFSASFYHEMVQKTKKWCRKGYIAFSFL